ncbi:hypothetical protein [Fusibacter sp. 3D3]|uniref:hypothetical protein n=1 Tax=Fusibacter sp. 3D3 TaxID=1048380 RepID=UPI0008536CC0|nr:hypothetical protein [Fusibacter sp. 3D3]
MLLSDQKKALLRMISPNPILTLGILFIVLWLNGLHTLIYLVPLIVFLYILITSFIFYNTSSTLLRNIKKYNSNKLFIQIKSKNIFAIEIKYYTEDRLDEILVNFSITTQKEILDLIESNKNYHFIVLPSLKKQLILKIIS